MKKIVQSALFLLAFLPAISFAQGTHGTTTWPEMEKFHSYMAAAFHPVEEGNYAPLKANADSLFEAARVWQRSAVPADFKPAETKVALRNLVIKCGAVQKAVIANRNDMELKKLITEAHDAFHVVVGECRRTHE